MTAPIDQLRIVVGGAAITFDFIGYPQEALVIGVQNLVKDGPDGSIRMTKREQCIGLYNALKMLVESKGGQEILQ